MMVYSKSLKTIFSRKVGLFIVTLIAVMSVLLLVSTTAQASSLLNTSSKQATPYLAKNAYIPSTSSLSSKNIVSSEKNLPTKLYYGKSFPGYGSRSSETEVAPFVFYYSNSKYDKSAKVNVKHLTENQQLELARYGLKLINQYRKLYGLKTLKITYKMVKLEAKYIAYRLKNNIDRHAISKYDSLYTSYINKGTLNGKYKTLSWADSENLSYDYSYFRVGASSKSNATTMLQLKVSIYNGISQMMFCDGGSNKWGHRKNFLDSTMTEVAMGVQYRYKRSDDRLLTFCWNMGSINDGSTNLTSSGTVTAVDSAIRKHNVLKKYRAAYVKKVKKLDLTSSKKKYYIKKINSASSSSKVLSYYKKAKRAAKKYFNSYKKKTLKAIKKLKFKKSKQKAYYYKKAKKAKTTSQLAKILKAARKAAKK